METLRSSRHHDYRAFLQLRRVPALTADAARIRELEQQVRERIAGQLGIGVESLRA